MASVRAQGWWNAARKALNAVREPYFYEMGFAQRRAAMGADGPLMPMNPAARTTIPQAVNILDVNSVLGLRRMTSGIGDTRRGCSAPERGVVEWSQ